MLKPLSFHYRTRRLHAYLLGELILPTIFGLALYTFTLLMNEFFLVARQAVGKSLGWDLVFQLFVFQVPKVLVLTIPMATLLGTLIATGRISSDHEWVAIQSAGLGPPFLVRPVLLHGLLATSVALFIYAEVVPRASFASKSLLDRILATSTLAADLRPRVFYDDLPGVVLFVDEILPGGQGTLERVFVHQTASGPDDAEQVILARRGRLFSSGAVKGVLEVDLEDGMHYSYRPGSPDTYIATRFARYRFPLKPPSYLRPPQGPRRKTVQDMDLEALFAEQAAAREEPSAVIRPHRERAVRLETQQRFALPVACLLFALLAMPLGINHARSGKGAGFALSLAIVFVYWVLFIVTRNQASRGRIPVLLGAWGANLAMLVWVLYAHLRMAAKTRGGRTAGFVQAWAERVTRLRERAFPGPTSPPSASSGIRRLILGTGFLLVPAALVLYAVAHTLRKVVPEPLSDSGQLGRGVLPLIVLATAVMTVVGLLGRVDRYLVFQYLKVLLLALLSAYLVYSIVELKGLLDGILQNRQPLSLVGRYFKYFAPGMLQFALPVACLVAGVVSFTLLSRKGELTALKAAGMSMRRAVVPVVAVTLLLCGLLFVIQDQIAPVTNRKAQEVRDQIFGRTPRSYGYGSPGGGRWTFGTQGRLYHYRFYDPAQRQFQGLSALRLDPLGLKIVEQTYATSAHWSGSAWEMEKGWRWTMPEGVPNKDGFAVLAGSQAVSLDPPESFSRREASLTLGSDLPDQMSLEELGQQIRSLRGSGYDTTRLRVGYFGKLAQPLTPLVMLLLGLPFAFRGGRSGSLYGVGVSLVLVIVYWATLAVFQALGLETILPPLLAALAPNVVYGFLGAYLMLYVRT